MGDFRYSREAAEVLFGAAGRDRMEILYRWRAEDIEDEL